MVEVVALEDPVLPDSVLPLSLVPAEVVASEVELGELTLLTALVNELLVCPLSCTPSARAVKPSPAANAAEVPSAR